MSKKFELASYLLGHLVSFLEVETGETRWGRIVAISESEHQGQLNAWVSQNKDGMIVLMKLTDLKLEDP
jgi:hypothetical protein